MAIHDLTGKGPAIPAAGVDQSFRLTNVIDVAAYLAAGNSLNTGDTVYALYVPAYAVVRNVVIRVLTANGVALTATVGDASDATGWDAATDLNAAVNAVTYAIVGTDAYAVDNTYGPGGGKLYTTAVYIKLVLTGVPTLAKFAVMAECFNYNHTT